MNHIHFLLIQSLGMHFWHLHLIPLCFPRFPYSIKKGRSVKGTKKKRTQVSFISPHYSNRLVSSNIILKGNCQFPCKSKTNFHRLTFSSRCMGFLCGHHLCCPPPCGFLVTKSHSSTSGTSWRSYAWLESGSPVPFPSHHHHARKHRWLPTLPW